MQKDLAAPYLPAALQGGRHLRHPLETDRRIDTLVRRAASATSPTDGSSSALRAGVQSIPKIGSSPGRRRTALDFLVSLSADLARGHVNVPGFPNVVMKNPDWRRGFCRLPTPRHSTRPARESANYEPQSRAWVDRSCKG